MDQQGSKNILYDETGSRSKCRRRGVDLDALPDAPKRRGDRRERLFSLDFL